ncbi:MAG: LuxR C-terminal-related transcriptional regulator [Minicystis sp.]
MGLVRGVGFRNIRAFVVAHFGEVAWGAVLGALPSGEAAVAASATGAGWYDLAAQARLRGVVAARFDGGRGTLLEALGRFEAERDQSTITRWFFRVISPDFAIRHMDLYWRRFHDSGRWTTEVASGLITARLDGWSVVDESLCRSLGGYLERTVELMAERRSEIEHVRCRARGHAHCAFVLRWRKRPSAPPPVALSPDDLLAITHELSQITERKALGEAMATVLVEQLGCRRAVVWDDPRGVGEPLASAGAPWSNGRVHRLLLEAQGRTLGCLDLDMEDDAPLGEAMEALVPLLGLPLATLPRAVNAESEREGRVAAAAIRWRLTPRQGAVLACIVRGLANKDIAEELRILDGTVELHVTQILRKSGAESRAALIAAIWA